MELIEIKEEFLFPRLVADRSHPIYVKDLGRHMYSHAPAPASPDEQRITIHMMEDIGLNFVLDEGDAYIYLRECDREGFLTWDNMALISKAFLNLRDQHGEKVSLQQLETGGFRISSPGRHDAAFLLLGNLWVTMEEQLGVNMYAAVPSHDVLLVAPQDDRYAILTLQRLVRDTFFEAPTKSLLSKAIYQRWDGEWKVVATAF
jgi:uncharacterized protein YtpQ (UPF0354 family)